MKAIKKKVYSLGEKLLIVNIIKKSIDLIYLCFFGFVTYIKSKILIINFF